jgi:hypothetical protein
VTSIRLSSRALLAALAFFAAYASTPAAARANFDGSWNVLIGTRDGPCDRSYRFAVSIRNGGIFYDGSAPVSVDGRVTRNGSLRVRVSAGGQSADGAGRLSRNYGQGYWRGTGASTVCAGSWTAQTALIHRAPRALSSRAATEDLIVRTIDGDMKEESAQAG